MLKTIRLLHLANFINKIDKKTSVPIFIKIYLKKGDSKEPLVDIRQLETGVDPLRRLANKSFNMNLNELCEEHVDIFIDRGKIARKILNYQNNNSNVFITDRFKKMQNEIETLKVEKNISKISLYVLYRSGYFKLKQVLENKAEICA